MRLYIGPDLRQLSPITIKARLHCIERRITLNKKPTCGRSTVWEASRECLIAKSERWWQRHAEGREKVSYTWTQNIHNHPFKISWPSKNLFLHILASFFKVYLFSLLVDNIHLVGGVLLPAIQCQPHTLPSYSSISSISRFYPSWLPADSFPVGGGIVLIPTTLALSKTLLYIHCLDINHYQLLSSILLYHFYHHLQNTALCPLPKHFRDQQQRVLCRCGWGSDA